MHVAAGCLVSRALITFHPVLFGMCRCVAELIHQCLSFKPSDQSSMVSARVACPILSDSLLIEWCCQRRVAAEL